MATRLGGLFLLAGLMLGGCSAAERVDQETDCRDICRRHAECFDRDYDVSGCQKRCVDRGNDDEEVAADIEACDACLDSVACTDATDECPMCTSIVP